MYTVLALPCRPAFSLYVGQRGDVAQLFDVLDVSSHAFIIRCNTYHHTVGPYHAEWQHKRHDQAAVKN